MIVRIHLSRLLAVSGIILGLWVIPLRVPAQSSDTAGGRMFQPQDWQTLADALADDPQDSTAIRQAEAAVEAGLPDQIQTDWLGSLPVQTVTLADGLGLQVTPNIYLPTPATEPQQGIIFPRVTDFYVPTPSAGTERLLCRLHFRDGGDAALAARMGALLTVLYRTQVQRTASDPEEGVGPFDVWLCRQGKDGGDEWHRNIYFYDLDASRSSIEWIREIAHEYSHMALPPIGGYTSPEYWANGYYGERLLVRWVAEAPGGPALVQRVWGDFSGWSNFERLLITPAIALYKKSGPSSALAARTDELGMRYLIGQLLVFDDKYGAQRLAEALTYLPHAREARGPDFGPAAARMLAEQAHP